MVELMLMAVAARCEGASEVMYEMLATLTRLSRCHCPYPEDVEAQPLDGGASYQDIGRAGGDQAAQDGVGLGVERVRMTTNVGQD